jgi:HEPN domain-containing protein
VKKITEEWISKAEEDHLVAIRELQAAPPALDAVCFHAQQSRYPLAKGQELHS